MAWFGSVGVGMMCFWTSLLYCVGAITKAFWVFDSVVGFHLLLMHACWLGSCNCTVCVLFWSWVICLYYIG